MRFALGLLFLLCIKSGFLEVASADAMQGEIRGILQSLIYSYNQLDNKLERHEHRERALGELMKKAMQTLQKGQKSLEPLNGIFGRLDERVSQIETMLITQEEKYTVQTDKLGEALERIFKWMHDNDECMKRPPLPPGASANLMAPAKSDAQAVSGEFIKEQEKINKDLLNAINKLSQNVEKLLDNSKDMMQQTEIAFKSVPSTAEMLTKIEDKLVSYNVATPADSSEFESKVLEKFGELSSGLNELRTAAPKSSEGLSAADKEFIHSLANETMHALERVKSDVVSATDTAIEKSQDHVRQTEAAIDSSLTNILNGVVNSSEVLGRFYKEVNASYSKFNAGLEIFDKFNNILMTNSEYVLDTQRKVEFGTLQIVQKITDALTKQSGELAALMAKRFDGVDENIAESQMKAIQNLSATIESEISHVWHQIELMYGEITDSKDLLRLMQGRNEVYVNSTFSTMDTLSTKVEDTKNRMMDMDSNLNYLLGKISVISQEFKNIKIGLAQSLEELHQTFQTMQDQIPTRGGPGPHNIASNEYETELKLLNKRQNEEAKN